jgi:hypothetical protein
MENGSTVLSRYFYETIMQKPCSRVLGMFPNGHADEEGLSTIRSRNMQALDYRTCFYV